MSRYQVRIDGQENTLTFDRHSYARGYQYLTEGNRGSHAFSEPLKVGEVFQTNGHRYEILKEVSRG